MDIIIDYITSESTFEIIYRFIAAGGWSVLVYLLLYAGFYELYSYKRKILKKDFKHVLLAIDIPPMNVQTPKAVEQLFTHIFSVMEVPSIGTKYWHGFYQNQFSFEIVSIEGYIQFLIRTLDKYQDVIEAAVYAQYPEAEITEVEDYTEGIPDKYPSDTHKMWAADFVLTQHEAYPIRMYQEFEHNISKDTVLKDPMGTFLESFSRIGPGEQMWYQIIIEPLQEFRWKKGCIKKIKELIGEKEKSKPGMLGWVFDNPLTNEFARSFEEVSAQLAGGIRTEGGSTSSSKDDGPPNQILYLTPGKKKLLEAMENKISKLGFKTKIRTVYVAKKEVYNPSRGINSLVGAVNQFNNPYSNALLPKYITSTEYFMKERRDNFRKNIMMKAYKKRNPWIGKKRYVLNIEELATIWHFPMSHVATPQIQTASLKTSEPPVGLPIELLSAPEDKVAEFEKTAPKYMTDSGDITYDDGDQIFG